MDVVVVVEHPGSDGEYDGTKDVRMYADLK